MCVYVFNQLHRVFMLWLTKKLDLFIIKNLFPLQPPLLAIHAISVLRKLGH